MIRLITAAGLLTAAAFTFGGSRLVAVLLLACALSTFCWLWFIKGKRPEGELPSSSVSCCHYLGNNEEDQHSRHGVELREKNV